MVEMVRFRTKNLAIPSASPVLTTNYRLSLAHLRGCAHECTQFDSRTLKSLRGKRSTKYKNFEDF